MGGVLMPRLAVPIILDNRGDITACCTLAEALAYAEPVDVDAGEYEAFDSVGRGIVLGTDAGGRLGNRQTVVESAEESPKHADDLRDRVLQYLRRVGAEPGPPGETLGALVARLVAWQGASRNRR